MKTFIKKVLFFILTLSIISTIVCVTIDPFNVFHALDIKDNGVEPNKNYIKMTYILNNPDKFDTFIFGSSRVGNIHVNNLWGEKAYNMTYSEAVPVETLHNVQTLIDNGVYVKAIYLGVDNLSYTIDPDSHNNASNASYELYKINPIKFYSYYLDPAMAFKSYITIQKDHVYDDSYSYRFYEFGWNSDYGNTTSTYDFTNAEASTGNSYRLEETLKEIKQLKELCDNNNIKLVIFTNPMYYVTYDDAVNKNYFEFLKGLAEITEFCNFSGYNAITTDSLNWLDNSHYSAEVSDKVLECIAFHAYYGGLYEEGFGYWVNENNVDEFIDMLIANKAKYKLN